MRCLLGLREDSDVWVRLDSYLFRVLCFYLLIVILRCLDANRDDGRNLNVRYIWVGYISFVWGFIFIVVVSDFIRLC